MLVISLYCLYYSVANNVASQICVRCIILSAFFQQAYQQFAATSEEGAKVLYTPHTVAVL